MAEEEAVPVIIEAPLDHPHKRKLDDLEHQPPSSDVAPPDSTSELDGDRHGGDINQNDDENQNGTDEPAKRPRFDAPEPPSDGLASENGHKVEEEEDVHAKTNEAETEAPLEIAETTDDNKQAGDEEHPNEEAPSGEGKEEPPSESEQKVDDSDRGKDVPPALNTQAENEEKPSEEEVHEPPTEVIEEGNGAADQVHHESGSRTRRIEIPNNKVGVLIGKAGDTIKYLQINSGAKIQITRDADADPRAPTRPVELIGSLENLNKAERLIKDVIAEADAGGSPSLVARGFNASMTAGAEIEMHVPADKVGLIIGRGGETIRNLQTRSGARIQLIPQSYPGDQSKEKKVKVTGDKKQVEMAKELIKEVMNQLPGRPSQFSSSTYNQPAYRPRGPGGVPQWGNRGPTPAQPMPYDYHQRGPYPSQNQPYPGQSYGNYPPQGPPRSSYGSGWEHRPPAQGPPPHGGGYDYYGQGGGHAANAQVSAPQSAHMPGHASGPSMGPTPHPQANYNYGQPRGADYAQPTPYPQTAPPAQTYGHGYGEPKYDSQGQVQQSYGGPGYAPQQQGYAPQQQYNRPPGPYGMPAQGTHPQGYAPPAASQPADTAYQAPVTAAQPYGQTAQPQQQYPCASGAAAQAPYGSAPVTNEGYTQQPQPQAVAAGYPQPGGQPVAAYGQQTAGYAQPAAQNAGYGQYPAAAQPGYTDQAAAAAAAAAAATATSAAAYGYQAQVDPSAYAAGQAYSAPAAAQQGYAQPLPAQPGYDQSAPQSGGYASAPAGAPAAAYGKTVSPQPGYAQYDASQQMYAAPR